MFFFFRLYQPIRKSGSRYTQFFFFLWTIDTFSKLISIMGIAASAQGGKSTLHKYKVSDHQIIDINEILFKNAAFRINFCNSIMNCQWNKIGSNDQLKMPAVIFAFIHRAFILWHQMNHLKYVYKSEHLVFFHLQAFI